MRSIVLFSTLLAAGFGCTKFEASNNDAGDAAGDRGSGGGGVDLKGDQGATGGAGGGGGLAVDGLGPVDQAGADLASDRPIDLPAGTCVAGEACTPANHCHLGMVVCDAGGTPSCFDRNVAATPGSSCGDNMVCSAGASCVACAAGDACDIKMTCKVGKIECGSGTPVCTLAGNATEGSDCGASKVCSNGQCVVCSAGMSCPPANKCHTGTLSCAGGVPTCNDSGNNASDGASCGTNMVCKSGSCGACTAGMTCTPTNPCKTGKIACGTGSPVCGESGNVGDGMGCGGGKVCSAGGCVTACAAGVACTQGIGPCRAGKTFCASSTSAAECRDSGVDDSHATCSGSNVCKNGSCVAPCLANVNCRPSACHVGKTNCSSPTATPVCTGSTVDDSQGGCSGSNICINGNCVAPCQPHCVNANVAISCNGNTEVTNVCDANTTCDADSKTCVPCGQMWGQKCCPSMLEGDHCQAGPESFCLSGICTSTGHIGEPCIPGGFCKSSSTTVCKNNMCIACGPNAGATCCADGTPPNGCTP